jgi:toxin YoeB
MYELVYSKKAIKDLKVLGKNSKVLNKVKLILSEVRIDPFSDTHNFERLKHNYSGFCSKRLDKKNRILYRVEDDKVIILVVSILGHYE